MSGAEVFLSFIKIVIVIAFLMNMAAISVWADRRQSAMLQHRVGPNRAVVNLPWWLARALMIGPAWLVAGLVSVPMWFAVRKADVLPMVSTGVQFGILVGWLSLLLLSNYIRKHGSSGPVDRAISSLDPRAYFYGGLVLHLAALVLVPLIPKSMWTLDTKGWGWPLPETFQLATGLSGFFVLVVICSSALYAAMKVERGSTVGLRLAGTLHSVADAIKLIWKEDLRPRNADKLLYGLAPLLAMFPALVTFAVLPFGNTMCFVDTVDKATKKANGVLDFGELTNLASTVAANGQCAKGQIAVGLQVADLNVGLLYIFAIAGTGIIGAALAGWASDNKFALLGGLRATSQMVSYEVALGLSIVGMLMVTGSVHMGSIVDWQGANAWGIFVQPLGFLLFLTAVVAETKRVPFDQPEGESELVAGYFLEYSGMKFGLFFLGEYAEFVFSSALLVTLFFGGYHLPFIDPDGIRIVLGSSIIFEQSLQHWAVTLIHVGAFFGKTMVVMWLHVFIRWTLPRFRYDQVMKLGWTKLLPLALVNILLTGMVLLACMDASPPVAAALDWVADLSHAFVALAGVGCIIWMITGLLDTSKRPTYRSSSSARYAAAAGGVKAGDMQA